MTITIAVQQGDVVFLACDSASTDEAYAHVTRKGCSKAWVQYVPNFGDVLVGFSGNFAAGMWIRHGMSWPPMPPLMSSFEQYLVVCVHPALVKSLGKRFKADNDENRSAWQLLVALPGDIFTLHSCGDVESSVLPFAAIGDGCQIAHGAMFALQSSPEPVWEKLEKILEACLSARATVRGPLHILALGRHGVLHLE